MIYQVEYIGNGWFNFDAIPQQGRYIKISNLHCGTDRKAINQAKKIIGKDKIIEITSQGGD